MAPVSILQKGQMFARYVIAKAAGRESPVEYARVRLKLR
jgi:hypothetical protein